MNTKLHFYHEPLSGGDPKPAAGGTSALDAGDAISKSNIAIPASDLLQDIDQRLLDRVVGFELELFADEIREHGPAIVQAARTNGSEVETFVRYARNLVDIAKRDGRHLEFVTINLHEGEGAHNALRMIRNLDLDYAAVHVQAFTRMHRQGSKAYEEYGSTSIVQAHIHLICACPTDDRLKLREVIKDAAARRNLKKSRRVHSKAVNTMVTHPMDDYSPIDHHDVLDGRLGGLLPYLCGALNLGRAGSEVLASQAVKSHGKKKRRKNRLESPIAPETVPTTETALTPEWPASNPENKIESASPVKLDQADIDRLEAAIAAEIERTASDQPSTPN